MLSVKKRDYGFGVPENKKIYEIINFIDTIKI